MNKLYELWPYVALAEKWNDDLIKNNSHDNDYIPTTLREWGIEWVHCDIRKIGPDISYYVETKEFHLFVHLGTNSRAGWGSNLNPFNWLFPWKNMHRGFGKAGFSAFRVFEDWLSRIRMDHKPVYQAEHSRGSRGESMARFIAEYKYRIPETYSYCPAEVWTKKGRRILNDLGLWDKIKTIISENDIVDNTGLGRYSNAGEVITLPEPIGYDSGALPFVGGHRYSAVHKGLILDAKNTGDTEGEEWLKKTLYICEN